jgi:predicted amidohydrolase
MDEKKDTTSHQAGCFVCTTAIPLMQHVWTEATRDHFRNSRIEFLKGLRSLLDNRISHLTRGGEEPRGTHVPVE